MKDKEKIFTKISTRNGIISAYTNRYTKAVNELKQTNTAPPTPPPPKKRKKNKNKGAK